MKKIFLTLLVGGALLSCSNNEKPISQNSAEETTALSPAEQGKQLIQRSDCVSCHKTEGNLIGPSYQDIAQKYTDKDIDKLADKIIDGGVGNWGETAMTPHLGLSKEDAKLMVQYILTLKN